MEKEYMKMAMLKQEETFRHQVHELHRLYRVQKKLMSDVKEVNEADLKQQCCSGTGPKPPCMKLVLERPAEKYTRKRNGDADPELEEESDLELTLVTGGRRVRPKAKETSFTSDSVSNYSSSSGESETAKFGSRDWGAFQVSGASMLGLRNEPMIGFDIEGRLRQDVLKQPPWLFQQLSLNMTS